MLESMESNRFFKGWAKPGSEIPGGIEPESPESLDALSGNFRIFQLRDGHRFSTDDLLAAWYGSTWCPSARRVLELGSGIGTVGLICAWRLQGASFVTVEAQAQSVALARKSLRYNGVEGRFTLLEGDFRDPAVLPPPRSAEERFDLVLGSPPYFPLGSGIEGDHPQKIACRFEVRGDVGDYCQVAARQLGWGGVFACVFPMQPEAQLERVREGARAAGLSIVRWRPVVLREGEPPLLAVFAMTLSEHLPEGFRGKSWQEPPLVIRTREGAVHPEYQALKLAIGFPP